MASVMVQQESPVPAGSLYSVPPVLNRGSIYRIIGEMIQNSRVIVILIRYWFTTFTQMEVYSCICTGW
jgi:hypothetical protein